MRQAGLAERFERWADLAYAAVQAKRVAFDEAKQAAVAEQNAAELEAYEQRQAAQAVEEASAARTQALEEAATQARARVRGHIIGHARNNM